MSGSPSPAAGQRAVVLGASMAGLLAARVLAERFQEVLLLERDTLPTEAGPRKGTPQAVHAHGLLARGREELERLFPGFTQALAARGGVVGDLHANAPFVAGGRRFAPGVSKHLGLACSRPAIEAEVRRRVLALPGVRLVEDVDILEPACQGERVHAARVRQRASGAEQEFAAELVVDCTGRASHAPEWLRAWGFEAPQEERVVVGIGYSTVYLRREPEQTGDLAALIFTATPELPLPGAVLAQEPGVDGVPRWVVTLAGYAGDHPSPTLDAMRERALRMREPTLVRLLKEAEPLGPVLRYAFPHSQRRRYEKLARFPRGFLVMGDAIASFNPVYGQGMTVATCECLALRAAVGGPAETLHQRFFAAAAKAVDTPWQLAVGGDLAIPVVQGERPAAVRFVNGYIGKVLRAAPEDPAVALAFLKVAHMVAPPQTLFAPMTVARALWHARRPVKPPSEAQLAQT